MRIQHLLVVGLCMLAAPDSQAQTSPATNGATAPAPKIITVINRANWCPVCLVHGKRAMALMPRYQDQAVAFFPNDLTNKTTKAASRQGLAQLGVAEVVAPYNSTGVMLLIDAQTRRVVQEISIAKSTPVLTKAIDNALASR